MSIARRLVLGLMASLVFLAAQKQLAFAQIVTPGDFFFDDFEDGSLKDNDPVNWGRGGWSGATEQIVNGDLEINGTRNLNNGIDGISILAPRNASDSLYLSYDSAIYRTQARLTQVGDQETTLGFLARSAAPSGYFARISSEGELLISEFPDGAPGEVLASIDTSVDPVNNDVIMELITSDDSLAFRVWELGNPRPAAPQISAQSDTFPFGTFGVYVRSTSSTAPASAVYRWVSVSEVPEPATAGLLICALFACGSIRRNR